MARLAFCDYHNMIAILEKYKHNTDFHQIVDFIEASHLRRARIAQSSALLPVADEPASLIGDDGQGEACPTDFGLKAEQDKANITKTSTLHSDSTPRDLERSALKAMIKHLEDRDGGDDDPSGEDATIKGKRLETGEEAGIERSTKNSNDTKEMANILTSLDAASVLTSGVQVSVPLVAEVTTISVSPATISVPTGSDVVPTASPIFTTATVTTPYSRKKGKEKMVESDTPKKKKLQEQIDVQEEGERFKRKGLSLEQESAKKVKTSDEVSEEELKQMMHLVPVKEVYVEALQVKHTIIDWEILTEGQRSYWKIIRLGGSTASYQFFVDMLKHFDREDLNQLFALVKETLNIRQATSDKEKEL
nr:hypothetical protein [Tanacetum cinerariifolium]